jgi:hypothetical protein
MIIITHASSAYRHWTRDRVAWGGGGYPGAHAHQFWCAWAQRLSRYSLFCASANKALALGAALLVFLAVWLLEGVAGVPGHQVGRFP